MDKKSVEKTVEVKEPVVEQKVVTPTPVVKVRRKRWGFKLIFWLPKTQSSIRTQRPIRDTKYIHLRKAEIIL